MCSSPELTRCKQITGVPTTLRQIIRVSTIDKDVFVRYFKTHPDTDLLTGDEEKAFNKKMLVVHQREAALKKYGDSNFNNRDKYRSTHYKESVRDDIISKIDELGTPVTSRYLSDFLPYNHDVIENYTIYFNIDGVLHGEDAKKFNSQIATQKRRNYYLNNPNAISHMVSEVKRTKKGRYGNPNYNNCEKMLDTKLSKLPLEFANLYYSREESINFLESHSFISREQLKDYFGVSLPTIEHWIVRNDLVDYAPYLNIISQKELELRNILLPYGFNVYNSKKIIFPYEIDIYQIFNF